MVGSCPLRPIGRGCDVATSPVGARRSLDRVLRQSLHEFVGEPADDRPAGPIGHAVDPDDKPAGRKPTQVVIALYQQDLGAKPPSSNGGRRSGRATADHQHVGFGENWNFARGLEKRFAGADVPHPITAAKQLKTLSGADAAAIIAAAW